MMANGWMDNNNLSVIRIWTDGSTGQGSHQSGNTERAGFLRYSRTRGQE